LNGLNFNLSRMLSPPLAGLLIVAAGPAAAFAVNAVSFVPTVIVMRPRGAPAHLEFAAFRDGFAKTIALANASVPVRNVLLRLGALESARASYSRCWLTSGDASNVPIATAIA
jgi:Transmembrane secretion effector